MGQSAAQAKETVGGSVLPRRLHTLSAAVFALAVGAPAPAAGAQDAFLPTGNLPSPTGNASAIALPNGDALVFGSTDTAQRYDHTTGALRTDGPLIQSHVYSQAVLLRTGKVLLATGTFTMSDGSTELYDPSTHASTATGSMVVGRWNPAMAVLPDGRVFIAGGIIDYNGTPTGGVEIYDPGIGQFAAAGHLTIPRAYATATALPDGTVLVAGGLSNTANACPHSNGVQQCSAERCDPVHGTCAATGSMGEARWSSVATALADGRVMVSGGWTMQLSSQRWADGFELYDPTTGLFTGACVGTGQYRLAHTATLLPDGEVLLAGGVGLFSNVLTTSALVDPVALQVHAGPTLAIAHDSHAAVLLTDGSVFVAGGETYDAVSQQRETTADTERFVRDAVFSSGFEGGG